MSRYTKDELREMAQEVLADHAKGGHRSMILMLMISDITKLNPNTVRDRIQSLAKVPASPPSANTDVSRET